MKPLHILHQTEYRYRQPVALGPHVIRLTPRGDAAQQVQSCELDIQPPPQGRCTALDAHGNIVTHAWFDGRHDALVITSRSTVTMLRQQAFDFRYRDGAAGLPIGYSGDERATLAACLQRGGEGDLHTVANWARTLVQEPQSGAGAFLWALNTTIHRQVRVMHRPLGRPMPPLETLQQGQGACRDLATLFIDACRSVGIAARFVSGYYAASAPLLNSELHAWAEVYLPGGGWRGYDPTEGLAVTDRHVVVAAAPEPPQAAPVEGCHDGDPDQSVMTYRVQVHDGPTACQ